MTISYKNRVEMDQLVHIAEMCKDQVYASIPETNTYVSVRSTLGMMSLGKNNPFEIIFSNPDDEKLFTKFELLR